MKIKKEINCLYLVGAPRITTRYNPDTSGPRSHILGFIEGLKENKVKIHKWIAGDNLPPYLSTKKAESKINKNFLSRILTDFARIILNLYNKEKIYKNFKGKVDFVYERFSLFSNLGEKFKKKGIPWIVETNALQSYESSREMNTSLLYKLAQKTEKNTYEKADLIVCISETLKKILCKKLNISKNKIIVIPNGINPNLFNPLKTKQIKLSKNITICFAGKLIKWHNLEILLEALAEIKKENLQVSLVIIGDGPLKESLKEKASLLKIEKNVFFVGQIPHEKIPEYIMGSDFCYSGHIAQSIGKVYNSPLKLYEYLAMGKPVITTKSDDALKLIKEGKNGFFFGGSKESLIKAIKSAINKKNSTKKNDYTISEDVRKNHSWKKRAFMLITELKKRNLI